MDQQLADPSTAMEELTAERMIGMMFLSFAVTFSFVS